MVNVAQKEITHREAMASGVIKMSRGAFLMIKNNTAKKGPVLQTAVIAAIMAAKKTSELIPMCHPLNISGADTDICDICDEKAGEFGFILSVRVMIDGKTGVEMEALVAVSVGLLAIYDMIKAIDKTMIIGDIKLLEKSGGKSGHFVRGENCGGENFNKKESENGENI